MDDFTKKFLEDMKKKQQEGGGMQFDSPTPSDPTMASVGVQSPGEKAKEVLGKGLHNVGEAGGTLLTKAVSGVVSVGNFFPLLVNELERNTGVYDTLFGKQADGTYDDRAGKFHWDKLDDVASEVAKNVGADMKRVRESDSLTELSQNAVSGADILKNLPGALGEAFKVDDARTRIGTGILGFGLELLVDPVSKIGKGTTAVVNRVAQGTNMSAKATSVTARLASNATTGNWVAGPVALGLRETSQAAIGRLKTVASDPAKYGRKSEMASSFLEWAVGPMALADEKMAPVIRQYIALKEELSKKMLGAASMAATVTAGVPRKYRKEVQDTFAVLAANTVDHPDAVAAKQRLMELGIKENRIDSVRDQFFQANTQIIGLLDEGRGIIPGLDGVTLKKEHLAERYYLHAGGKATQSHLDKLIADNTPGSWQFSESGVRSRLEETLGIRPQDANRTPGLVANNTDTFTVSPKAVGNFFDDGVLNNKTNAGVTVSNTPNSPTARVGVYGVDLAEEGRSVATTGKLAKNAANRVETLNSQAESLTKRIETIDSQMAKLNPDNTTGQFKSGGPLSKLALRMQQQKMTLEAKLESVTTEIEKVNQLAGSGIDSAGAVRVGQFTGSGVASDVLGKPATSLSRTNASNYAGGSSMQIDRATGKAAWTSELVGRDRALVERADMVTPELRTKFTEGLMAHLDQAPLRDSRITGFVADKRGIPTPAYQENVEKVRQKSLSSVVDYIDNFAIENKLSDTAREALHKNTVQSMVYVPGSREFANGVKAKKDVFREAGAMGKHLESIGVYRPGLGGVDQAAIADPVIDDLFKPLLGQISEFTPRAAMQATDVSNVAVQSKLRVEMMKRGLVKDAEEIKNLPPSEQLGWVQLDTPVFGRENLWVRQMDKNVIKAVDRSMADIGSNASGVVGAVSRLPQTLSNLFKRSALTTDISAHATQYLGNITMLRMMGYDEMFTDTPKFAGDMRKAFNHIVTADDMFSDAIDAGVGISQSVLDQSTRTSLVNRNISLPKSDNAEGAVQSIFSMFEEWGNGISNAVDVGVRKVENNLTDKLVRTGLDSTTASKTAAHGLSATSQFQMADQLTRMYAYKHEMGKQVEQLVRNNPWLEAYRSKSTGLINFKAVDEFNESVKGTKAMLASPDDVAVVKEAYRAAREDAARVANDVALNYADVPLAVSYLSKSGVVPFIKYQYKATGRIMEWFDEKPWVYAPFYTAQRNAISTFNDDPQEFETQVKSLPKSARDSLVLPMGTRDEQGNPAFLDLARWLPFGMFTPYGSGGGQASNDGSMNSLVSTPLIDLYGAFITDDGRKPDQSKAAFVAGKLAETFAPAGWGAGGRRIESLARAIEQTTFTVDEQGNVIPRQPTALEKVVSDYAAIPERIGAALDPGTGSALGVTQPSGMASRTTPETAAVRMAVPGYSFTSDPAKTAQELSVAYDSKITLLKQKMAEYNRAATLTNADTERLNAYQAMIDQYEVVKARRIQELKVGE